MLWFSLCRFTTRANFMQDGTWTLNSARLVLNLTFHHDLELVACRKMQVYFYVTSFFPLLAYQTWVRSRSIERMRSESIVPIFVHSLLKRFLPSYSFGSF